MKVLCVRRCHPWMIAAGCLAVFLSGCNTPQTTQLDLTAPASAEQDTSTTSSKSSLGVAWLPIDDQRLDATSLGNIGNCAYVTKSILPWVDQQLHAIKGTNFGEAGDPAKADLVIKPILLKLYIQNVNITKSAVVVFRLELSSHGKSVGELTCRGRYAGMNWSGSDDEMTGAIQKAFADCVSNITASLELNIKLQHTAVLTSG
jgi:hypothetical protein